MCLASLTSVVDEYEFGKKLGEGTFGVVRVAEHKLTGARFAAKIISQRMPRELVGREISNQACMKHANVVALHEVFQMPETGQTVMLMELVDGIQLFDHVVRRGRLTEPEARRIFQQLMAALEHCHEQGVAHRDLKPENILLDQDLNVKVTDFGFSERIFEGVPLTRSCGSPNYAAPELLRSKCEYQGEPVDIWSAGVCLYAMLAGNLPFDAENVTSLFRCIKCGKYKRLGYLSQEASDLLARMMTVDAGERITLPEILRHPWFSRDPPSSEASGRALAGPAKGGAVHRCASQWLCPPAPHKLLLTVPTWPARCRAPKECRQALRHRHAPRRTEPRRSAPKPPPPLCGVLGWLVPLVCSS